VPYIITDTLQDSVSLYLKSEGILIKSDSLRFDFGNFEYLPTDKTKLLFDIDTFTDSIISETLQFKMDGNLGSLPTISPLFSTAVFFLFLICFMVFSIIFSNRGSLFIGNFKKVLSLKNQSLSGYKHQVTTSEVWSDFFMIFQSISVFSIIVFTFLLDKKFIPSPEIGYATIFIGVFFILVLLIGLKYLMYKVISAFFLKKHLLNWLNRYFRLLEFNGIVLLFPAIIYFYIPEVRDVLFSLIIMVLLIGRAILFIELLIIFVKNKIGTLYFFVYLCGTEIAPYFLFYRGILSIFFISGNDII